MSATADLDPAFAAEDKGPSIIAVTCTVSALSTLFVLARIYTRGWIIGKLQLDDYLIVASAVCGWVAVGFSIAAVRSGNGRHMAVLTLDQISGAVLFTILSFPPGILSFGLPKLAVVHLLSRLMNPGRRHKIFLWVLVGVCLLLLLGCVAILFGQCTPSRSQWDFDVEGTCISKWVLVDFAIVAGSFSAMCDLYLAAYPAYVLWGLQLPKKKKIALVGALGIGSIGTVVAIYKTTRLPGLAAEDFSWETSDLIDWTIIEGSSIIIAACIPTLQPFLDRLLGRKGSRYYNYGSHRSGSGPKSSDYEMSGSRKTGGGAGHSKGSKAGGSRLGIRDEDLLYTQTPGANSSEDSILKGDASMGHNSSSNRSVPEEPLPIQTNEKTAAAGAQTRRASHARAAAADGIVRTQVVTVEYDTPQRPQGTVARPFYPH